MSAQYYFKILVFFKREASKLSEFLPPIICKCPAFGDVYKNVNICHRCGESVGLCVKLEVTSSLQFMYSLLSLSDKDSLTG